MYQLIILIILIIITILSLSLSLSLLLLLFLLLCVWYFGRPRSFSAESPSVQGTVKLTLECQFCTLPPPGNTFYDYTYTRVGGKRLHTAISFGDGCGVQMNTGMNISIHVPYTTIHSITTTTTTTTTITTATTTTTTNHNNNSNNHTTTTTTTTNSNNRHQLVSPSTTLCPPSSSSFVPSSTKWTTFQVRYHCYYYIDTITLYSTS